MPNKTVVLKNPIKGHGAEVSQIVLREPGWREFSAFGEPAIFVRTADKVAMQAENDVAIKSYVEACLVAPADALLIEQLSLVDSIAIKETMLDFFRDARQAL